MTARGIHANARTTVLALALLACACNDDGASAPDAAAPDAIARVDAAPRPVVVLATTMGDLVVRLEPDLAPITTANFLGYVDAGFYDGTLIHRVVADWVIQGGGYTAGLEAKAPGAPIPLETNPGLSHVHGAISMARVTGDLDSATSQWFIVDWPETGTPPQPASLDGQYAAFGLLVEGLDVLEAISQVSTATSGALTDVPATEIVVTSARRR